MLLACNNTGELETVILERSSQNCVPSHVKGRVSYETQSIDLFLFVIWQQGLKVLYKEGRGEK